MNVWFLDSKAGLKNVPSNRIYNNKSIVESASATFTFKSDDIKHTYNGNNPINSADNSIGRWTSFPQIGKKQSVVYSFKKATRISEIAVYWYRDSSAVNFPKEWDVEYRDTSGKWKKFPIYLTDSYSVLKNQYNAVHPSGNAITATAVKINIVAKPKYAVGILQIKFTEAK